MTGRKPFVSVKKLEKPRSLPKVQGSVLRGTGQTCARGRKLPLSRTRSQFVPCGLEELGN